MQERRLEPRTEEAARDRAAVVQREQRNRGRNGPERPLLIVSDRPAVFAGLRPPGYRVMRWTSRGPEPGERHGTRVFGGDPTATATYQMLSSEGRDGLAIIALRSGARAMAVVEAIAEVWPDVAVLVVAGRQSQPEPPAEVVSRRLSWSDLLVHDLATHLDHLVARRWVKRLRRFADGAGVVPIVMHQDPDPDAIASAFAVRAILRRNPEACPIVTPGESTRPENRRMTELLRLRSTAVRPEELARFERLVCVDVQPTIVLSEGWDAAVAVIDHHPIERHFEAELMDVRPDYGATASILTEYLRADDERRIHAPLATALLYGIKTDTAGLSRGVSPADVRAYAFLEPCADATLLSRIERPAYSPELVLAYGRGLASLQMHDDLAVAFLGSLREEDTHVLPEVADFCLAIEDVVWAVAAAWMGQSLIMNLRYIGNGVGAGDLARRLAAEGGKGGGHATMARVVLQQKAAAARLGVEPGKTAEGHIAAKLLQLVRAEVDALG